MTSVATPATPRAAQSAPPVTVVRRPLPTHEVVQVESDWKTYWGSNKQLLADIKEFGAENFDCWIYIQCKTKKQLTYYEMQYQCSEQVLIGKDRSYNDNILGKFFTKDLVD
jgi:hypothetical protein